MINPWTRSYYGPVTPFIQTVSQPLQTYAYPNVAYNRPSPQMEPAPSPPAPVKEKRPDPYTARENAERAMQLQQILENQDKLVVMMKEQSQQYKQAMEAGSRPTSAAKAATIGAVLTFILSTISQYKIGRLYTVGTLAFGAAVGLVVRGIANKFSR